MIRWKFRISLPGPEGSAARFCLDSHCEVDEWGIIGIYGPSGCGKTTLLRLLAGLLTPDSGYLYVGQDIWLDRSIDEEIPCSSRSIGYLFQEYALFPHLTVRQNLEYTRPTRALAERITRILELDTLLDEYPSRLSGGQQQRVALGRSLARCPRILLLDEPFGALDSELKTRLYREIRDLHQEFPMTVFLVSHDQGELDSLADCVLSMTEGRLVFPDTLWL